MGRWRRDRRPQPGVQGGSPAGNLEFGSGAGSSPRPDQEERTHPAFEGRPFANAPVADEASEPLPGSAEPVPAPAPAEVPSPEARAEALLQTAKVPVSSVSGAPAGPEPLVADGGDGGPSDPGRNGVGGAWLSSTQAAVAVIVFLVAAVGFLAYKVATPQTSHISSRSGLPSAGSEPPVAPPAPSTTFPSTSTLPTTTVPAPVVPTTAPVVHPAFAAAQSPPTTTVPPQACVPGDIVITTVTDRSSYVPGEAVGITTKLVDQRACIFQPVASGAYACPVTMVVQTSGGSQAWPWPGQGEQCSKPTAGVMQPGTTETVRTIWNGQVSSNGSGADAPAGSYVAQGTWAWSAGPGQPTQMISAASTPFTISS
ncbi:MAG TPA: hypothetical protein VKR22_12475 [Acidimicrobiales bacterium]|nr:hypothetical protein [Acidimicrobiales bacterium]